MAFYLKIGQVRSSCSPRAPHKDKPKDFLQEDGRNDIIGGRGHSDEIVGDKYEHRHSWTGSILTLTEDSFLRSLETSRDRFFLQALTETWTVRVEGDIKCVNSDSEYGTHAGRL